MARVALDALHRGERARVTVLLTRNAMRRRLLDIGLTPGTWVVCELKSPSGDPVAYRIRGALIALRRADAAQVLVEPEGTRSNPNERKKVAYGDRRHGKNRAGG